MTYEELARAARGKMGPVCKACPVCNGRACGNHIPGPGAKGTGTVAMRNFEAWKRWRLAMDTIFEQRGNPSTETTVFGRTLSLPVMVAPLGDVRRHYGDVYDDLTYNEMVLTAARDAGTLGWTGDGLNADVHVHACELISRLGGAGVTTIKPWDMDTFMTKLQAALAVKPFAVACDIDGAGLPFLKGQEPPAGPKSIEQLARIVDACHAGGCRFVLKGILTVRGARKAAEAGVDGIVVSNHGGRVLDGVCATAEVLPQIAQAVGDDLTVFVDGGIRSGTDVFRALALGARAVLVCRPVAVAAYGGGAAGVTDLLGQLRGELADAMAMCGANAVGDISRDMLVDAGPQQLP